MKYSEVKNTVVRTFSGKVNGSVHSYTCTKRGVYV